MCRQGQAKALMVIWLAELTDHSCYNWWTRSQMPQEINTAYSESAACREREREREREKHYISSSHLGLIRCLTPIRVSAIIYTQTFCDKLGYHMQISLTHELDHCIGMLSKQLRIVLTDILQAVALKARWNSSPGWPTWQTWQSLCGLGTAVRLPTSRGRL